MKILVLGANGNLGTSLVPKLIETNKYEVVPFTRRDCNVMDLKDLKEKIEKVSPDVIINTVAYNKVDACENDLKEQELAIALNMRLPKNLALICEERNIKLIHFSTNYVFSGEKETYTEFDEAAPVNFYGLSKLLGEEAVKEHMDLSLDAAIVRVSNIYGTKGTGVSSKPNFFETMLKLSADRDELSVVDDELCCFTYIDDISDNLINVSKSGILIPHSHLDIFLLSIYNFSANSSWVKFFSFRRSAINFPSFIAFIKSPLKL